MKILALDPSTKVIGWAILDTDLEVPDDLLMQGAYVVRGDTLDEKLLHATAWAYNKMHDLPQPDAVAIEMPVVHKNARAAIILAQMVGALRSRTFYWTNRTIEINSGARLSALGLPVSMKRAAAKRAVVSLMNVVYDLGLEAGDHDIADAIAVGWAARRKL